ncbi:MAG: PilN domain-containing protein [Acidisphaera sp.]|nr:PilN domain-containing protein [Acidisphaera sp.]
MLKDFVAWWAQQMRDLVPGRALRGEPAGASALVVDTGTAGTIGFLLRRRRRETPLGRVPLDEMSGEAGLRRTRGLIARARKAPIVLRPPAASLLERRVVLPLSAEREPEAVLRYEMDRLTPFTADEVFWSWGVEQRDRAHGRLHLRVSLVPKAELAPVIAALARLGAPPALLEAPLADGGTRSIGLGAPRSRGERWRRRGAVFAGVVCAALAIVAAGLPFVTQARARAEVEARIAALQPEVARVEAVRRRIAGEAAGVDVLAQERLRVGDAMQVLATLTEILPDDTYLTDLTLRQRKLVINGQSATAAKLIGLLSSDPSFRNPAFVAPVTRTEAGRADLFSIRAELGP